MNLYQKIRAAISKRRRGPNIAPTADDLALLAHIRYCRERGIAVTVRPYSPLEIIDRLGWEAARDRQAVEGLTDFETIELTGYYPR